MDMDIDIVEPPIAPEPVPTFLNTTNQGYGLEVSKDKLTVKYVEDRRHGNDVGAIQANCVAPCKRLVYYYELTVLDQGESARIAIGFADKSFKLTRQPGWEPNSFGYHGDDGRKYSASGKGEEYGPTFGTGDTVGAGIHFGRREIFFTKNGTKLKCAFRDLKSPLLPTVGLHSKGETVELNFGQKPFKFDLEGMIADERAAQQACVDRVPLSSGTTHQLVRKYLLHYGYADTLKAFDEAAGGSCDGEDNSMAVDDECYALSLRQELRRAILAGDVDTALRRLQEMYPSLLKADGLLHVHFHLQCQKYIELLRRGDVEAALAFAQSSLACLRPGTGPLDLALRNVVALIAYERPEDSPLGHLLSLSQRERVADVVNSAVLALISASMTQTDDLSGSGVMGGGAGSVVAPPVSELERLLRQLVAVMGGLHEANGGQGEVFSLGQYLVPANQMQ